MEEQRNGSEASRDKMACACGAGCGCGHGRGCGRGHYVIWWVVGIAILIFVFALGVRAGEFRDELRGAFGNYYRGYPMMQTGVYNGGGVAIPVEGSVTGTVPGATPAGQ